MEPLVFVTRVRIGLLAALLLASLASQPAAAQVLYGSILGAVRDPSGSGVPNATIKATNVGTGLVRETKSNETGLYTLANALPGTYDVEVSAPGFRAFSEKSVVVTINTVNRVDVALQVGELTETVTVAAEATPLQTDKTDVHVELGSKEINDLPLGQYRNYQSLLDLTPGSAPARFQNAIMDTPGRALTTNVNGTVRNSNNTRTDGAPNIQGYLRHHVAYVSPAESIETVNITTNNFDAEQGLAGGAAITVVTKSGTNDLHGSAFAYHNNQHLNARNFFLRSPGKAKTIDNFYGGTLGGPIKTNTLFYFVSWEATRERIGLNSLNTVPTADQRAGDFSAYGTDLFDPGTGDSNGRGRSLFAGAIIPLTRQSQIIRKLQAMIPPPNQPGTTSNFFAAKPQALNRDFIDGKVSWNRSANHNIWGKYALMGALVDCQAALGDAGGPGLCRGGGSGLGHTRTQLATIGHTWTLKPTLLIDGNIGFSRMGQNVKPPGFGKNVGLEVLGIPGTNGSDIRQSGFPRFSVSGYQSLGDVDNWSPLFRNDQTFAHTTNVGWTHGPHDVRFGFDLRRIHVNHWQPEAGSGGPRGRFDFGNGVTALRGGAGPNQFNAYAAFLLGLPTADRKSLQFFAPMGTREWQFGGYVRDRWQATRNLTLTLGVRYEYYPLMTRPWSGLERYDLDLNKVFVGRFGNVPDNAGTTVSKRLFAPRLGVAYRANAKTVIRTGYGITIDPDLMSALLRSPYPAVIAQDFVSANSFVPYRPIEQGIPVFGGPDFRSGVIDIPGTVETNFLPKGEFHRGYIQSWNFTVERELPWGLVGSAGYVGQRTVHQIGNRDLNFSSPGNGDDGRILNAKFERTADTVLTDGMLSSNYHSLQTTLNRRFANGLFLKGAYTFAKAINESDESGTDDGSNGLGWTWPPVLHRNRALAGFDRTHTFQFAWVYELPLGPTKKWVNGGGLAGALARGWQINGHFSSFTGTPFTVSSSGASLDLPNNTQTADQVKPVVQKLGGIGSDVPFYDPLAFRGVTDVRFGTTGRNILRRPGNVNLDLGLFRSFPIGERYKMEFRAEAFNVSNTPHFSGPATNASNIRLNPDGTLRSLGGFMAITSTVGNLASNDERNFRFALRFAF